MRNPFKKKTRVPASKFDKRQVVVYQTPRVTERYKDLRKIRSQSKLKTLIFKIKNIRIRIPKLRIFKYLGILFILAAFIVSSLYAVRSDEFSITEIELQSNTNLDKSVFNTFIDKNIFRVSIADVKNYANENIPNLQEIYVRKILPNKLTIELNQNKAFLVMANFDSYYIIGENYEPIQRVQINKLTLASFEDDILNGNGDYNSEYIKERYLSTIEDTEERKKVEWDKIPVDDKKNILNGLTADLQNRVAAHFENIKNEVSTIYPELTIVNFQQYSNDVDYKSVKERLQFSMAMINFLKENGFVLGKSEWYENFFYRITFDNDRTLIFSIRRDLEEQKDDVLIAKSQNLFQNGRIFDFRTDNFSLSN